MKAGPAYEDWLQASKLLEEGDLLGWLEIGGQGQPSEEDSKFAKYMANQRRVEQMRQSQDARARLAEYEDAE